MKDAFATAQRMPPSRFTKLAELRENTVCGVQGIVVQSYEPERTQGTDYKSVLLLSDPTLAPLGSGGECTVKVNLFFPRRDDHPCLAQSRVGDVFQGFKCSTKRFRGKIELTLSEKAGSSYEIVTGEHSNEPLAHNPSNEETEVLFLRTFRLSLLEQDPVFAKRAAGPGGFIPRAYPRVAGMAPPPPPPPPILANPYAQYMALPAVTILPNGRPAMLPPAPVAQPAPVAAAAVPAAAAAEVRKSIEMLVYPVAGSKGYVVDLSAVKILSMTDARGDGVRMSLVLWDGTGPRLNSLRPSALAENVFATCWEASLSQELKQMGDNCWVEISRVRVAANKQQEGEIELHLNQHTLVRRVPDTDPCVLLRLQHYAAKEARAGARAASENGGGGGGATWMCKTCAFVNRTDTRVCGGCSQIVPMTTIVPQAGHDKWQCSACHTLTFKSRSACYGCQKPFNKDKDLSPFAPLAARAANAPPPLGAAGTAGAMAAPESEPKRVRRELTEVVGVSDALCIRGDATRDFEPRITRLANVTTHLQDNGRFVVQVKVLRFHPRETRHFTRPFCGLCHNPVSGAAVDLSKLGPCATCGSKLDANSLQFSYMVALDVKDGAVTIPVLICGSSADLFFRGLSACDLWSNHKTHQYVAEKMDMLCNSGETVRMAVQSYIPAGSTKRVYRVFNTMLT